MRTTSISIPDYNMNADTVSLAWLIATLTAQELMLTLKEGELTHPDRSLADGIRQDNHIARAIAHLEAVRRGADEENHLGHALTRIGMELAQRKIEREDEPEL